MIGIIGAMDEEVSKLIAKADITAAEDVAGMTFHTGKLAGADAVIVRCGVGKVNAGICTQLLISRYNAAHVINTGFAGSLSHDLGIGDIVVSTDAVQHDLDATGLGFKKGEIPFTGMSSFTADRALVTAACKVISENLPDVRVFSGRICSGDQFISDKAAKERICADFGGLCCEMEGAAVAQVCCLNHIPFIILRAISDSADEAAGEDFNFSLFQSTVADKFVSAVVHLVKAV
ncbi:MAG: 5'-methylthioadenosine/adenosylhomocysteine nucleosidase [Oscillospiraceae bacterium]|nr:5'-methylthioadenosine/adenosylhomocysteine nucleosidase [Oscillospiraceae bacterium]